MSKIIVTGVDGSETAAQAARTAAELAVALGADLRVLAAFDKFESETFSSGEEEIVFTTAKHAERTATTITAELRREFSTLSITADARRGKPANALVETAQQVGADIIVVGNKRVQGIARVLGSIAREVAAHAPCDVYVAHTHQR